MKKLRLLFYIPAFSLMMLVMTSSANAQATRTWVSGVGDDANPCSRTAPCKTFAGAISKTAVNGEIDCLDPGGFGAVTITKSITIDCGDGDGGYAGSVLVNGTPGIVVSAPANAVVNLRNIGIQGIGGGGTSGIRFLAGAALHVQSVMIIGFSQNGIDVTNPGFNVVTIRNSAISDIGGPGVNVVDAGFGGLLLDTVQIANALTGVHVGSNAKVAVLRSNIVGNTAGTTIGINADTAGADVTVDFSQISFCSTGISVTAGAGRVANSTINNNQTGVTNVSSTSPATNLFIGNTSDGTFATAVTLK
jgi:hypothetical protein